MLLRLCRDVLISDTAVSAAKLICTHRFIPSRVDVTRQTSARAYMAVNSSNGTERCMKIMGDHVGVLNWPLILPTSSFTHERRFMYSSTS